MAVPIRIKNLTRATLDALATTNQIAKGEPFLITDESRLALGLSSNTYQTFVKESDNQLNYRKNNLILESDFLTVVGPYGGFGGLAILSGTINSPTLTTFKRPGLVRFRSSTTANSGYQIATNSLGFVIQGKEEFLCSLITGASLINTTTRIGFYDTNTVTDAIDGCYFEILSNGLCQVKNSTNNVKTISSSTFQILANTYYWFSIKINVTGSSVTYKIFLENGNLVYTETLTANIPYNITGRDLGTGVISTISTTTATDLLHLDYMAASIFVSRPILNI